MSVQWLNLNGRTAVRPEGYGACPVHQAKKNATSFSFNDDGRFFCFSCQAKGRGAIDLVMAIRKVGFQEAVKHLEAFRETSTAIAPVREQSPPRQPLPEVPSENSPFSSTYEKYKIPSPWLTARGFTQETVDHFGVFQYENKARRSAYNGSVMLKIQRWSDGATVGYLSRNIGEVTQDRPKYVEVFGAVQLKEKRPVGLELRILALNRGSRNVARRERSDLR